MPARATTRIWPARPPPSLSPARLDPIVPFSSSQDLPLGSLSASFPGCCCAPDNPFSAFQAAPPALLSIPFCRLPTGRYDIFVVLSRLKKSGKDTCVPLPGPSRADAYGYGTAARPSSRSVRCQKNSSSSLPKCLFAQSVHPGTCCLSSVPRMVQFQYIECILWSHFTRVQVSALRKSGNKTYSCNSTVFSSTSSSLPRYSSPLSGSYTLPSTQTSSPS
jgi:hypothetical protein